MGHTNPSFGATHGFGYNESNDYIGGDSHNHALDRIASNGINHDFDKDSIKELFKRKKEQHIFGYDSVNSASGSYSTTD